MRYEATARDAPAWHATLMILVAGLVFAGHASAQCDNLGTSIYAQSAASRLNGNTVKLYNQIYTYGNYWNWWYSYLSSGFYLDGSLKSSYPWGTTSQIGAAAWQSYEPTLQYWGPGQYYTSAWHNAYTPYCEYWFWANAQPTADQIQIQRPVISRGVIPYWLGGELQSNDYSASTSLSVDPKGAPETPVWSFTNTHSPGYAQFSCTNCANPNLTVTQRPSQPCDAYDLVFKASFNGFDSEYFWIDIHTPNLLSFVRSDPIQPQAGGWQNSIYYRVFDGCNGQMTNVQANEVFTWWSQYNGSNWDAPLLAEAFPNLTFDGLTGQWLLRDNLYEVPVPGKNPQPMNIGTNGYRTDPQFLMTQHTQQIRVGSTFNGGRGGIPADPSWPVEGNPNWNRGVLVQTNPHYHYITAVRLKVK